MDLLKKNWKVALATIIVIIAGYFSIPLMVGTSMPTMAPSNDNAEEPISNKNNGLLPSEDH